MVIDTSALFAIAFDEPERDRFARAILAAPRRLMSAATAVECVAVFSGRRPGQDQLAVVGLLVERLAIEVTPLDEHQWRAAAQGLIRFGKGRHPATLNLGDSYAYGLAKVSGEPLLFKGDDFAKTDLVSAV
jgi:ribonuclease VapC